MRLIASLAKYFAGGILLALGLACAVAIVGAISL